MVYGLLLAGLVGTGLLTDADARPGGLWLVGGGSTPVEVVREFVAESGGGAELIVVLSQMREEPWRGAGSVELLAEHGARNVLLLSFVEIGEQERAVAAEAIGRARGVWLPGGDQELFMERWGAAWLGGLLRRRVAEGLNVFGTSAGAMAMSGPMMIAGPGDREGTVSLKPGLGLTAFLVDTHYRERGREPRLADGVRRSGVSGALGLSEGEWVVLRGGVVEKAVGAVYRFGSAGG